MENTTYLFFHMLIAVPLKSGDGGEDDDASARTRSKSKTGTSSKK